MGAFTSFISGAPALSSLVGTEPIPAVSGGVTKYITPALLNTTYVTPRGGDTGPFGFRNRLINGNFVINQRAVSGTVTLGAGVYGHDRWKAGASGCTYTFATTIGSDTILTITSGSLQQVIEGANVEGSSYIMSWYGTAQGKINGGSYGASGVATTSATAGSNLTVEFGTGTLSRAQVEAGATVSPYERISTSLQYIQCMRYYWGSFADMRTYGVSGSTCGVMIYFPVPMYAAPTMGSSSVSYSQNSTLTFDDTLNTCTRYTVLCTGTGIMDVHFYFSASAEL